MIALYPIVLGYAIVKHQLLDIDVIVKKTLVFAGMLATVFAILVIPTLVIQEYLVRSAGFGGRLVGLTISGIIIIFSMRRIENFLINITDKYLFQKKYDYRDLLKTFTTEVLTVLELDALMNLTVTKLIDIMKLKSCAVLFFDEGNREFVLEAAQGTKESHIVLGSGDPIVLFVKETKGYMLLKDFTDKNISIPPESRRTIDALSAELLIPMILNNEVLGILALGKKKSDEDYSEDDLRILVPLAKTLAIAIANAKLFDELGKTQAEAAQKEKMAVIGTLAAGMAHEIRNPITTIKTFTEFLKERKDDPEFIERFERLVPKEINKINHMISHLLEFSKPADHNVVEAVDISEAFREVLSIVEHEMALNDIVPEGIIGDLPLVRGNKKHMQEVFLNLLQNSIQAIGRRGKVRFETEVLHASVRVSITDTGCGISGENMNHLFEPFFTTKLTAKGVGLGLYVIKQLMMRMDASINVESRVGIGTTFRLEFKKN